MSDLRDKIRSTVLATRKPKFKIITFFDEQIELRQPTLADILAAQNAKDSTKAVASVVVQYAFVPDTEERVFDDADYDALLALPFDANWQRVSKALEELTEVNFLSSGKSSDEVQPSTPPTNSQPS